MELVQILVKNVFKTNYNILLIIFKVRLVYHSSHENLL